MLSLFIIYHKVLYDSFYQTISEENKKNIIFYGVKDKVENTPLQISSIYEYELQIYNKDLQEKRYNESSAFYHIYKNNLHQNLSYIGFAQYDMIINNDALNTVKKLISENPEKSIIFGSFFAIEESKINLHGSLRLISEPLPILGSILDNYNRFFSSNYKRDDIIKMPWIMCNTFIVPVNMYEKYMTWLSTYFTQEISQEELCRICFANYGFLDNGEKNINRGHLIEICTGLFLAVEAIEGAFIQYIDMEHEHAARV